MEAGTLCACASNAGFRCLLRLHDIASQRHTQPSLFSYSNGMDGLFCIKWGNILVRSKERGIVIISIPCIYPCPFPALRTFIHAGYIFFCMAMCVCRWGKNSIFCVRPNMYVRPFQHHSVASMYIEKFI